MRTKEMNLSQVRRGMTVTVHKLQAKEEIRRRLLDIGLIEGTKVCCLYSGPSGDPTAYLIRGTVVALRREDAGQIRVLAFEEQNQTAPMRVGAQSPAIP